MKRAPCFACSGPCAFANSFQMHGMSSSCKFVHCMCHHQRHFYSPCVWSGCTVVNAFLFLQANTVSSVLRTLSMRSIQLERTSNPPTTSCGPSSCHHPVVAWTRRPHTLWREVMLATGRTRSTEWSGGWTEFMVSWGEIPCRSQKYTQLFRCG